MALKKKKPWADWSPMASIPPSGMDLRVTLTKVKIKVKEEKVKHFHTLQVLL